SRARPPGVGWRRAADIIGHPHGVATGSWRRAHGTPDPFRRLRVAPLMAPSLLPDRADLWDFGGPQFLLRLKIFRVRCAKPLWGARRSPPRGPTVRRAVPRSVAPAATSQITAYEVAHAERQGPPRLLRAFDRRGRRRRPAPPGLRRHGPIDVNRHDKRRALREGQGFDGLLPEPDGEEGEKVNGPPAIPEPPAA